MSANTLPGSLSPIKLLFDNEEDPEPVYKYYERPALTGGVWPLITRRFRNKFAISGYCQFFHFLSFGHLEVSYQISLRQRRPQMSKSPNQVELTLQISYKVIYSFYFDQKYGILKFLLNTTFCILA